MVFSQLLVSCDGFCVEAHCWHKSLATDLNYPATKLSEFPLYRPHLSCCSQMHYCYMVCCPSPVCVYLHKLCSIVQCSSSDQFILLGATGAHNCTHGGRYCNFVALVCCIEKTHLAFIFPCVFVNTLELITSTVTVIFIYCRGTTHTCMCWKVATIWGEGQLTIWDLWEDAFICN